MVSEAANKEEKPQIEGNKCIPKPEANGKDLTTKPFNECRVAAQVTYAREKAH
jgi:hypothetical protein